MSRDGEPVEAYLDELLARLHGRPRDVRRVLRETEDHLYAEAEALAAAGADPVDAEREAVTRFGSPATVAHGLNRALPITARGGAMRALCVQLLALAGIGLVAVGVSGLVEAAWARLWGLASVVADPPGTQYSATACHHWESLHPHAATCAQAYIAEAMSDGLFQRGVAGLAGIGVLAVWFLVRRRRRLPLLDPLTALVPVVLGVAAFCVAAVLFAGLAADRYRMAGGDGAGQWSSAGVVAAVGAIAYGVLFVRSARRRRPAEPGWA